MRLIRTVRVFVLSSTLLSSAAAFANQYVAPTVIPIPVAPPEKLVAGSQYYPFTLEGVRRYLDGIRGEDPKLFAAIDPSLADIEHRHSRAKWVGYGGMGLGLLMLTAGVILSVGNDSANIVGTEDGLLILGGGALAVGSGIAYFVMAPSRDELMEVVNLHNRVSPSPLRFSSAGGGPITQHTLRLTVARF